MLRLPHNTALIIIDVQQGMDHPKWGPRNNPEAEQRIAALLAAWRVTGRPVFHVQHLSTFEDSPLRPSLPGCALKECARPLPGEPLFQKNVNSAFIGTRLESALRERGIRTIAIAGLTTPHCISTSVRMAGNLSFEVYLPADACAAFDLTGPDGTHYPAEVIHRVSLATLHGEFATVVDSQALLDALQPY